MGVCQIKYVLDKKLGVFMVYFGEEKLNEKRQKEYEAINEYLDYGEYDEYSLHEQLADYIEAEVLGDIGVRLNQRVYLWAAGFLLACEQLEIIKLVD